MSHRAADLVVPVAHFVHLGVSWTHRLVWDPVRRRFVLLCSCCDARFLPVRSSLDQRRRETHDAFGSAD